MACFKIGAAFHKIKLKKKEKRKKRKMWLSVSGSCVWSGTKKQNNAFKETEQRH